MSDILVSICCITYNQKNYIRRAISGFLMQKTNFKYEILIHDDASTDGTAEIIKEYQSKNPDKMRSIIRKENKCKAGMDAGTCYGFEPFCQDLFPIAKGKYLALCEGDDYWVDENKLQKQVDYMERHPEHSMCHHATNVLDEETNRVSRFDLNNGAAREFTCVEMANSPSGIATASKMLRNYYKGNEEYYNIATGDYLMTALYATFGSCGYVKDIQPSVYRIHKGGVWSGKTNHQKHVLMNKLNQQIYDLYKKLGQVEFVGIRQKILDRDRRFGIVVPTFQRGDGKTPFFLKRCIDSVVTQSYSNFFLYVVGDDYVNRKEFEDLMKPYKDDGRVLWKNLEEATERIKYFDNKEALWSCGGTNATNYGMDWAERDGLDYICLLDHDDCWKKDHLKVLTTTINETGAVWLCTKTSIDLKQAFFFPKAMEGKRLEKFLPAPGDCIKASVCFSSKALPFRVRDVYAETGEIYPGDADLWRRMSDFIQKNGLKSYYIGQHTCIHDTEGYIRHGGIITQSNILKHLTPRKVERMVTGVVVTYNTKDFIKTSYESVRKFHPNMQIIIVDGSDKVNSCYEYICTLADENTRVFHAKKNIGHGLGLRVGLSYVKTPFALLFDSDIEMLKSPVQAMLEMMEDDTYGVGYIEKTAFDGHEWGSKPIHKTQGWMRYLHPYFCLIQLKEYRKYAPFIHHGAPAVNTMLDIHKRGLGEKVIKEFPGLGHSSGKGWVWEGQPREFIRHDPAGTRTYRRNRGLEEIEGIWDKVMAV
jgi:glycosyltransferase involved in cell wall biosynthesis